MQGYAHVPIDCVHSGHRVEKVVLRCYLACLVPAVAVSNLLLSMLTSLRVECDVRPRSALLAASMPPLTASAAGGDMGANPDADRQNANVLHRGLGRAQGSLPRRHAAAAAVVQGPQPLRLRHRVEWLGQHPCQHPRAGAQAARACPRALRLTSHLTIISSHLASTQHPSFAACACWQYARLKLVTAIRRRSSHVLMPYACNTLPAQPTMRLCLQGPRAAAADKSAGHTGNGDLKKASASMSKTEKPATRNPA